MEVAVKLRISWVELAKSERFRHFAPVTREFCSWLYDLEAATNVQFAVVILGSVADQTPQDFANRLFSLWGVGQKGKDNGILLLLLVLEPMIGPSKSAMVSKGSSTMRNAAGSPENVLLRN
jgi:hypothetical protein